MSVTDRFAGPDCGVDGCQREVGHIGLHRRVEMVTPAFIDRASFGLPPIKVCDGCGHPAPAHAEITNDGCFIDDCLCELTESAAGNIRTVKAPFEDLEDENADLRMALAAASAEIGRLRSAIETFILWWDMPPYVLDDDDGLRGEVDALREVIK